MEHTTKTGGEMSYNPLKGLDFNTKHSRRCEVVRAPHRCWLCKLKQGRCLAYCSEYDKDLPFIGGWIEAGGEKIVTSYNHVKLGPNEERWDPIYKRVKENKIPDFRIEHYLNFRRGLISYEDFEDMFRTELSKINEIVLDEKENQAPLPKEEVADPVAAVDQPGPAARTEPTKKVVKTKKTRKVRKTKVAVRNCDEPTVQPVVNEVEAEAQVFVQKPSRDDKVILAEDCLHWPFKQASKLNCLRALRKPFRRWNDAKIARFFRNFVKRALKSFDIENLSVIHFTPSRLVEMSSDYYNMFEGMLREYQREKKIVRKEKLVPLWTIKRQRHPRRFRSRERCYGPEKWPQMSEDEGEVSDTKPMVFAESSIEQLEINDVQQEQNTTFVDQRETVKDQGFITQQLQTNMQSLTMQESTWNIQNIMAKPLPIYQGEWSTKQNVADELKFFNVPGDMITGAHYNQCATFAFWRGHPKIKIQLNGTKFHAGRLLCAFVPRYMEKNFDQSLYHVDQLMSCPHGILDAGVSNSVDLDLPFVHENSYFNTTMQRNWQSLGRLVICVFNKLVTGQASPTLGFTVWVSWDKCELHQPMYAHDVQFPKVNTAFAESSNEATEGLMKSVGSIAKAALPTVANLVAPGSGGFVQGAMDAITPMLSEDKPTDPAEIQRWVPNTVTSLNFGDGLDKSNRLSLYPGSFSKCDEQIVSTTRNDMDLAELCKIPMRVKTLQWSSTAGAGTRLYRMRVCPQYCDTYHDTTDPQPLEIFSPSILAYISRGFKYWRGSLRYKIQVIASQMHTGRLMIAYAPGCTPGTYDQSANLNTYIIDLQERHEVEFVVPYMAERPWLRCDSLRKLDSVKTPFMDTLGWLTVHIQNRLSRPDSAAPAVDINVFISAGDDFELAFPTDFACFQGIGNVVPSTVFAESSQAETLVTSREHEGTVSLSKGGGNLKPGAGMTMSENAMDLSTVLKRYYPVFTYQPAKTATETQRLMCVFWNSPTVSTVHKPFRKDTLGTQFRTHLAHYSQLFTFWKGSLRYKLLMMNDTARDTANITVFHLPQVYLDRGFEGDSTAGQDQFGLYEACYAYGTQIATSRIQGSLEFEIPFYTPYNLLTVDYSGAQTSLSHTGSVVVMCDWSSITKGGFKLFQAAGDDFHLLYLRAPPRIQFVLGSENARDLEDNAVGLYTKNQIPNWLNTKKLAPSSALAEMKYEQDDCPSSDESQDSIFHCASPCVERETALKCVAEALVDYVTPTSFKAAASSISRAADQASTLVESTVGLISGAASSVGTLTSSDEEASDDDDADASFISGLISSFGTGGFLKAGKLATRIASIVSAVHSFVSTNNLVLRASAVVAIVGNLIGDQLEHLRDKIHEIALFVCEQYHGCNQPNAQPQAESGFSLSLVPPITAALGCVTILLGLGKVSNSNSNFSALRFVNEKMRFVTMLVSAGAAAPIIFTKMREAVESIVDWIMMKQAPTMFAHMKLEKEFEEIQQWAQFIDYCETVNVRSKAMYDFEFAAKVGRAYDRSREYTELLLIGKIGKEASIVREYCQKATILKIEVDTALQAAPTRIDPYTFALFGETGVGKSGVVMRMINRISEEIQLPVEKRVCPINPSEEFFTENYDGHTWCYIDDFGQFTGTAGEAQYKTFFNLKSNTAFPLNMAFKKGKYFTSLGIAATMNSTHQQPNCITTPEALHRRWEALVEVAWRDPALKRRWQQGDRSVYDQENCSHAQFRFCDPLKPNAPPGAWLNYEQTCMELSRRMREHLRAQRKKLVHELKMFRIPVPEDLGEVLAEAGEVGRLDVERAQKHPHLLMNEELLKSLVKKSGGWEVDSEDEELHEEWYSWTTFYRSLGEAYSDTFNLGDAKKTIPLEKKYETWDKLLDRFLIKPTVVSRFQSKMLSLKNFLSETVKKMWNSTPMKWCRNNWGKLLAGALAIVSTVVGVTSAITCICKKHWQSMRYRCKQCGRWPKRLQSNEDQGPGVVEFFPLEQRVQDAWRRFYGDLPYEDGRVTTLEEEQELARIEGRSEPQEITAGTLAESGNTYSVDGLQASPKRVVVAQSMQQQTFVNQRIHPYQLRLHFPGSDTKPGCSVIAMAIGGRKILCPAHFFEGMKHEEMFAFRYSGAKELVAVPFLMKKCKYFKGKDAVVYEMPPQFRQFKSALHLFVKEQDLASLQSVNALWASMSETGVHSTNLITAKASGELTYNLRMGEGNEYREIFVQNTWKYNVSSAPGDCGAMIVCAAQAKTTSPLLGFHIASEQQSTLSYATVITYEMLVKVIGDEVGIPLPDAQSGSSVVVPHEGNFTFIGRVTQPVGRPSGKTEIMKSPIHGELYPVVKEPAVLKPNDPRLTKIPTHILSKGIAKYGEKIYPFPPSLVDLVFDDLKDQCLKLKSVRGRFGVLSEQEAIFGIEGLHAEGYERMDMDASPGYPYLLKRPRNEKGKAYLFDIDRQTVVNQDLRKSVDQRREAASIGNRVVSVWTDCLKDEKRNIEKVKSGSTRVFTIPPVDYTIVCRQYTLDFANACKAARKNLFMKVGIAPESLEWSELYHDLAEFSKFCIAGDFSRFDGTIPPELIARFGELIAITNGFQEGSPEWKTVETLMDELIHTVQLAQGEFYMTHQGNPSGNPLTVILNSFVNYFYMALAWLIIMQQRCPSMATMAAFHKNVKLAVYGDDNLLAVKPEAIERYNQETIADTLRLFGITYTADTKDGVVAYKNLDECSFLKRHFGKDRRGIIVPLMSKDTIHELLNWMRGDFATDPDLFYSNLNDALRFMYFYGHEEFTAFRERLVQHLIAKELYSPLMTWNDFDIWFQNACGLQVGVQQTVPFKYSQILQYNIGA